MKLDEKLDEINRDILWAAYDCAQEGTLRYTAKASLDAVKDFWDAGAFAVLGYVLFNR